MLIQKMPLHDQVGVWCAVCAPRITGLHPSVSLSLSLSHNMEFSIHQAEIQ
jgi:hypothetical protein